MPEFRLVFSKPVLRGRVFDITHDRAEHPSGAALDREIVVNPPSAVMLARDDARRVLLVGQYRLPLRENLWELPAGRCDPGEDPLETARRELIEETGYTAERWTHLLDFYPAPGFATERMSAFLAEGLTPGEAAPEPYELIQTRWVAWDDALRLIRDGEIRDAKSIATLLYCATFPERGRTNRTP